MCAPDDDLQSSIPGRHDSVGLHVAINAHLLSGQAGYRSAGVHQYIHYLLRHLAEVANDTRITVLLGKGVLPAGVSLNAVRSRWSTDRPLMRTMWEQLAQPLVLHRIRADLAHGPVLAAPLFTDRPTVITVHDLSFVRFPYLFRPANRLYLTVMARLSARRARRLIAVSAHTASETTRLLNVPRDRIDVVYHGVDPAFRPLPADEVETFRRRHGLPDRFVLSVGTLEPRKNHARLVEAFERVRDGRTRLVLVGGKGWLYDDLFAKVETLGLQDDVTFAGYVPQKDLPLWYNAAEAFAYPSLYEGFGLPVIEAQACGTPVLTSNLPPLTEAAGDAALEVDAYNVNDIATELERLLGDEALQHDLQERGLAHAGQFAWSRTARETLEVYRRAVTGRLSPGKATRLKGGGN